ncbi:acyltransferase family protein [Pseudochelatococcus lubricantis]|uniref:acyltransferase family protein n=1 Tax=Pseudochelatococcus lubricantis TaxID=1538102 RepID=UPI0035EEB391
MNGPTIPSEYVSIQYLRAFAALSVVVVHLQPQLERMGQPDTWFYQPIGGVDILFVIGGFIMWRTTLGKQQSPGAFFLRRFWRIAPLYWLFTAFMLLVMLIAPRLVQSARFDPWHVLASFAFIPYPNPATGTMEPLLIPGWTLNYIMFFYLLFSAALLIPEEKRLHAFSALLLSIVALQVLSPAPATPLSFYTSSIILEFLLGMWLCAWHLRSQWRPNTTVCLVLLICACLAIGVLPHRWPDLPRILSLGLPAAIMLAAALGLERAGRVPRAPGIKLLASASYSLYLSHPLVLSAFGQLWRRIFPTNSDVLQWAFSLTAVAVCVLVAIVIYRTIERPLVTSRPLARALQAK